MTPQNGTTMDGFDVLGANFRMISEQINGAAPAPNAAEAPERGWLRAATRAIQDRPMTAAAIAFGLGYLASRLARR